MKIFDRIAGALGYSRIEHRADNGGGYNGGSVTSRGMTNWNPLLTSPNAAVTRDRSRIIARSRDMLRNAPIARGAVLKKAGKVVGTGLAYHSRIDADALGMTEDAAEEWQEKAEREFGYIASECDITAEADFYEQQYLAFLAAMDGDVLVTFPAVKRPGNVYATKIQLIEGDRVSNPDGVLDTPTLTAGIEYDRWGAVVAYHVLNQHPGEISSKIPKRWDRIEAVAPTTGRRVARLLYVRERVGQVRGMPMVAPLLEPLHKLDKFADSTLMNAIVSSMFTVFIETPGDGIGGLPLPGENNQDTDAPTSERNIRMGPAAVMELPPGYRPQFANPSNPNQNFDPFFLAYVRQMAMALETPYEVLMGVYNSSYSASRAALLDAWTVWKRFRAWLVTGMCQPFLEAWMDEAVAFGRLDAPGYFDDPAIRRAYLGSEWIGDAPGSLDPLKEAQAAVLKIEKNLSTHATEIASMSGSSWRDTIRQRARENKELLAAGLSASAQPGTSPSPAPSNSGDTTTDNQDGGSGGNTDGNQDDSSDDNQDGNS